MHRFTDRDIAELKEALWCTITQIFTKSFDFTPYIESKLITLREVDIISKEIKAQYPDVKVEPVATSLQPLIRIVRQLVAKKKETPTTRYTRYDCIWDDINWHRHRASDYDEYIYED